MSMPNSQPNLCGARRSFLWIECVTLGTAPVLFWILTAVAAAPTARADAFTTTQIAGHTLYVPKSYESSFMGYAGNLQIRALLPCLDPETAENSAEFHRNDIGRIVVARLVAWEGHALEGQQLLDTHITNSQFVKERHPDKREIDTGPTPVPGTNFLSYKDILVDSDLFALSNSHPLFLVNCDTHSRNVPPGICKVWEKIWGNVRLEYWYGRSFVDRDINNSIRIDARLRRLLSSFLTPALETKQPREEETCK